MQAQRAEGIWRALGGKRVLTEKENKKIRKMNLPPKVEAEVRDVWQGQPEPKKQNFLSVLSSYFISMILAGLMIANIILGAKFAGLGNIAVAIIWLVVILGLFVTLILLIVFFVVNEKDWLFRQFMLALWRKKGLLKNIHAFFFPIIIIAASAYANHIITAIAYLIAILLIQIPILMIREKVQLAMDVIEKED